MRLANMILTVAVLAGVSGCTLCAPGYLHDYAGVGGKWQRLDPTWGRVGSILSDPGTVIEHDGVENDEYYGDSLDQETSYNVPYGYSQPSEGMIYGDSGKVYADVVEGDTYREQNQLRVAAPRYDDVITIEENY